MYNTREGMINKNINYGKKVDARAFLNNQHISYEDRLELEAEFKNETKERLVANYTNGIQEKRILIKELDRLYEVEELLTKALTETSDLLDEAREKIKESASYREQQLEVKKYEREVK